MHQIYVLVMKQIGQVPNAKFVFSFFHQQFRYPCATWLMQPILPCVVPMALVQHQTRVHAKNFTLAIRVKCQAALALTQQIRLFVTDRMEVVTLQITACVTLVTLAINAKL